MVFRIVFGFCLISLSCSESLNPLFNLYKFPSHFFTENVECKNNMDLLIKSLENNELWAYRLWDSINKVPIGLTEGSQYQLGNYDECLSIIEPFSTQYCLATIHIEINVNTTIEDPFSLVHSPYINLFEKLQHTNDLHQVQRDKIYWALCMPRSCTPADVRKALQEYLNKEKSPFVTQYNVTVDSKNCQTTNEYQLNVSDILFCIVVGVVVFLVVVGTAYDLVHTEETKRSNKLILCFSAKANVHSLFESDEENDNFSIFHGFKFILMALIVYMHSLMTIMASPVFNSNYIETYLKTRQLVPAYRIDIIVDIYFFMGGALATNNYLNKAQSFHVWKSIILRYFRVVPVLATTIFFYATFFYKIGSGPLWPWIIGTERDNCVQNWWTNLLMISNYINIDTMCIPHSWYVYVDFHLFIFLLPLNYLILKNNVVSWITFITILCLSVIIPFGIIYFGDKDPAFFIYKDLFLTIRQTDYFQSVYIPSHMRASTYILGMLQGYVYFRLKGSQLKISPVPSIIIFLVAVIAGASCLYWAMIFFDPYMQYSYTSLDAALYGSLHRPIFILAFAVLCFIINFGSFSLLKTFLSAKIMMPLSRLSFGVYLLHLIFTVSDAASRRLPVTISVYYSVVLGISNYVLSLCAAFVLYIFVEEPSRKFVRELLSKKKKE